MGRGLDLKPRVISWVGENEIIDLQSDFQIQ